LALAGTNEFGLKWLENNAEKHRHVQVMKSGLQWTQLRAGTGPHHPIASAECEVHYEGRIAQNYPDGEKFDSSYDRGSPTTFAPNQVIKGWTEAMLMMVEGDKWELYVPAELGYGDVGSPPKIGPGDVLVFTMELIKIKGGKSPYRKCNPNTLEDCTETQKKYVRDRRYLMEDPHKEL